MKCWSLRCLLLVMVLVSLPYSSPAPLIYRPGEGWTYEPVGSEGKWRRTRAKDQMDVARKAFSEKDYSLALRASKRVVAAWPLSDYAPEAQLLVAECYQAKGSDERAFKEYQKVLEKYPKTASYSEILKHQVEIADRYLGGKHFRLWGVIPWFPSMNKTADMYEKIVKSGPYSDVAPGAQMKIGSAREKQKDYHLAAKAYELAADRYHDRPAIASDALYRLGMAYYHQAQEAEYDQSTAGQAISTFTDFSTLFPTDERAGGVEGLIGELRTEQARGSYLTARFYERYHKWAGALIYYNEVLLKDPSSEYATVAREKLASIKGRIEGVKPN